MKTFYQKRSSSRIVTLFLLCCLCTHFISAQYQIIHDFKEPDSGINSKLYFYDGYFYFYGQSWQESYFYKIRPDGSDFSRIRSVGPLGVATNICFDGQYFYGTHLGGYGSTHEYGYIFKVKPDGTEYTKVVAFDENSNCSVPVGLIYADKVLYGTSATSGPMGLGYGTFFKVNTDGTNFTVLKQLKIHEGPTPVGELKLCGDYLYTGIYQSDSPGKIVRIRTDGQWFHIVRDLKNDKKSRAREIACDEEFIYSSSVGGQLGGGAIFRMKPDGSEYQILKDFETNGVDGYNPGELILVKNTLYGTANGPNKYNLGSLFRLQKDGTGFQTLFYFDQIKEPATGSLPNRLISHDGSIYGNLGYGSFDYCNESMFKFGNITGVEGYTTNHQPFVVYPNPSSGSFKINFDIEKISVLIITDLQGKVVTKEVVSKEKTFEKHLSAGVYIAELTSGSVIYRTRLVVQ